VSTFYFPLSKIFLSLLDQSGTVLHDFLFLLLEWLFTVPSGGARSSCYGRISLSEGFRRNPPVCWYDEIGPLSALHLEGHLPLLETSNWKYK
jgi:hypothetical protein